MQAPDAVETRSKIFIDGNYEGVPGRLFAFNEPNLMTSFGVIEQDVFAVFTRRTLDNGRQAFGIN